MGVKMTVRIGARVIGEDWGRGGGQGRLGGKVLKGGKDGMVTGKWWGWGGGVEYGG